MRVLWAWAISIALISPVMAREPSGEDKAQARKIYQTIVEMDTSVEGLKVPEMAAFLADEFRKGGFAAEDVHVIPQDKTAALVVRYRGKGDALKPVLFLAHMDVVPAHRKDWERDPFKLVEENGFFFGRGSADNKSGLATLTATFLTLRKEGYVPARDLVLVFTGDEETSGASAKDLLSNHRTLIAAEFAVNSDAGGGTLNAHGQAESYAFQTAEKTFASFRLTAHNAGGHSSAPRRDNAIYDVADAVQRIRRHSFPVMWNATTIAAFKATGRATPDVLGRAMRQFSARPGNKWAARVLSASPYHVGQVRTTCIPTMLQAGHADNALPQSASVVVNCRIFPGVGIAKVQATLQKLVGKKIEIKAMDDYASSDASPLRADVVKAVGAAVHTNYPRVPIVPSMSSGATDGVFFRSAGIPTYGASEIFMKDSDDFSHGLNERVPVEAFYKGLTHWRVILTQIGAGTAQ